MRFEFAKKIIHAEGVENTQAFCKEKRLQIGLGERDCVCFQGKSFVILDFGKELAGGARLLTFEVKGDKRVRLRFGESVAETCAELGSGYKLATNDHSLRDMTVELQNYSDMTFGQTGFRFLRIDTLSDDTVLTMKTAVADTCIDQRAELGSFICDDEQVNEIWKTAAHTLRLCLQNGYFWDGIKRDRLVWIGDLYPEMRAAHCLFGDVPETVNSLDFAMEQTPLPAWINGIQSYSVWWLIILAEEWATYGDKPQFAAYLPYANGILRQLSEAVREDGTLTFSWNFVDWPTNFTENAPIEKKEDSETGVAYLIRIAMQKLLPFLRAYGQDTSLCEDILRRVSASKKEVLRYKQIAALGVWAGDDSVRNQRLVLDGGAKGLSTFMSYPILTAAADCGEYEAALNMMKDYYGGMLSVGATSFWEDFDLEWLENASRIDEMPVEGKVDIHGDKGAFCYLGFRHSFCHGWAAGVIPYLIETVAGVKTTEAGMRSIVIQPHLSGLKHVRAAVPTPYGVLTVEHTLQEDGSVKTSFNAPEGVSVELKNETNF